MLEPGEGEAVVWGKVREGLFHGPKCELNIRKLVDLHSRS